MAFTVTVTPGKVFASTEALTIAKLNQLGQPTLSVTGNLAQVSDYLTLTAVSKNFTYFGSADQLTCTAHGLTAPTTVDNAVRVVATSTGTLPTGLTAETKFFYYARVVDANTLTLHYTAVGALNNTQRVAVTAGGSGTHTLGWTIRSLGMPVIYDAGDSKFKLGIVNREGLPEMQGATATANGARGAVPQPRPTDVGKYLDAGGEWSTPTSPGNTLILALLTR